MGAIRLLEIVWRTYLEAARSNWKATAVLALPLLALSGCNWRAGFQCKVTNETGGSIQLTQVQHRWTGDTPAQEETPVPPGVSLNNGQSKAFSVLSGAGGSDLWTVAFNVGTTSGNCVYRVHKQCNIESSDKGSEVPIVLHGPKDGFDVILQSGSCNGNHYDEKDRPSPCPP
jgi:hypothetical protein